jgi:hypothetical protein
MNNDALMWVILVGFASLAANLVSIFTALRRKPPIEAEYATKNEVREMHDTRVSQTDCNLKMTALKSREQLDSLYLTRLEWNNFEREFRRSEANAENFRCVFNSKLDRQGKLLVALAVKNGVDVTEEA